MSIPGLRRLTTARALLLVAGLLVASAAAFAHGVAERDAVYLEQNTGLALSIFTYLGAKHMVTGYDHLLYLTAVIFFLYRLRDVAVYVTMFAIGHSITLLAGVLAEVQVNPYLVDGIIGLSVVYKAFENLGGFEKTIGLRPNPKIAVFGFGLVHGFGLATKLQDYTLSAEGLVANIIAFNIGVELGQLLALTILVFVIVALRSSNDFGRYSHAFNVLLMFAGFLLAGSQFAGLLYAT